MKQETKKLPGFYIALCCCVIAIGAAGYILQKEDTKTAVTPSEEISLETDNSPSLELSAVPDSPPTEEIITLETEPPIAEYEEAAAIQEDVTDYTYDNPDIAASSIITTAEAEELLGNPIPDITVLDGYSGDSLVYNEAYGDWRTHNGIDIEAELGCSVCTAADGTVKSVSETGNGKAVTIEHENGLSTVYAQLGSVNVAEGDKISANSVIGTVGEPIGENCKVPHLHYEVHKDGKPVNPEEY